MSFSVKKRLCQRSTASFAKPNPRHGQCRFVGPRIPRRYVGIHRLFLCKSSLCWRTLPHYPQASALAVWQWAKVASWAHESCECTWHSLAFSRSILPLLGCFTAPFSGLRPRCGSWANVASWVHESREYAWAFSGSSSVSSPSAGVLYRPIHWSLSCHICFLGGIVFSVQKRLCQRRAASFAEPNPRREPMSFRGPTNPANARGRSLAFPLSILPPLESFAASFAGLRPRRGFAGKCRA